MKETNSLLETAAPAQREESRGASDIVRGAALAAAGIGIAALGSARRAQAQGTKPLLTFNDIPGTGNIKVLNYALALETLEADLYVQAIARLQALGVPANDAALTYVQSFAQIEADHRDFLRGALGASAITAPGQPLATASFDFGLAAVTDPNAILNLLYLVENTGTQAYLGAIKYFTDYTYIAVAGGIQATEARHTATVAALLLSRGVTTDPNGNPVSTAPLSNNNNGIDIINLEPTAVLAVVTGPNGFTIIN
ncbi:MAG: ferritin-like domain-containing protein [Cytophagales bacterium]|nr:ferritin-like domain-containing protein [Armatimonadota bacterium]